MVQISLNQVVDTDDIIKDLDAAVLQDHLLQPILNIQDPSGERIEFVRRNTQCSGTRTPSQERYESISPCIHFIDEILSVADGNQVMPPKSTWFEPKLLSGLFIHRLS